MIGLGKRKKGKRWHSSRSMGEIARLSVAWGVGLRVRVGSCVAWGVGLCVAWGVRETVGLCVAWFACESVVLHAQHGHFVLKFLHFLLFATLLLARVDDRTTLVQPHWVRPNGGVLPLRLFAQFLFPRFLRTLFRQQMLLVLLAVLDCLFQRVRTLVLGGGAKHLEGGHFWVNCRGLSMELNCDFFCQTKGGVFKSCFFRTLTPNKSAFFIQGLGLKARFMGKGRNMGNYGTFRADRLIGKIGPKNKLSYKTKFSKDKDLVVLGQFIRKGRNISNYDYF